MSIAPTKQLSKEFSDRLVFALKEKNRVPSPTELAHDFNLRWRGSPVTVNAVRKWLTGEAIPTQDKLEVLAYLLNTSKEWLRWGSNSIQKFSYSKPIQSSFSSSSLDADLSRNFLQDYSLLSPEHKKLLDAVVKVLLTEQKNKT
jgi:hypothetical protein